MCPKRDIRSSLNGDGILNPGESFEVNFTINNNSFNLDAPNVEATLNSVDGIIFDMF